MEFYFRKTKKKMKRTSNWMTVTLLFLFAVFILNQHKILCKNITGTYVMKDGNELALLKVSHLNLIDTVVLFGLGEMYAFEYEENGNVSCVNATYTLDKDIAVFMREAKNLNITVYLSLLPVGNHEENVTVWNGACRQTYIDLQLQVADEIDSLYGKVFDYHWYIPQEVDLMSIPSTDLDCKVDNQLSYIGGLSEALHEMHAKRHILVSSFFKTDKSADDVAEAHTSLLECAPHISFSAPQDGVGSFGYDPDVTKHYFEAMSKSAKGKLWANTETFLPPFKICNHAPANRVFHQIQSVEESVVKIINFWAYNFKGAPKCKYFGNRQLGSILSE